MRRMTKQVLVDCLNSGIDPRDHFIDHLFCKTVWTAYYRGELRYYAYFQAIQDAAKNIEKHLISEVI